MKYVLDIPEIVYRDINGIKDYISTDNPGAAKKVALKIYSAIDGLVNSPFMGHELKKKFEIDTNLRCCIVKPYIVLYEIEGNIIKVYRVLDGRSNYLVRLGFISETDSDNGE